MQHSAQGSRAPVRSLRRRDGFEAAAWVAFLVLYGNAATLAEVNLGATGERMAALGKVLVAGLMLLWTVWLDRRPLASLGLGAHNLRRSLGWGAAFGLVALPLLPFMLVFPVVAGQPWRYPVLTEVSAAEFLYQVVGHARLLAAFFEEIAFRGFLQAKLDRVLSPAGAVVAASAAFAAWHLVVNYRTLAQAGLNLPTLLVGLIYVSGLVAVFVGGVAFSLLRRWTGNLAGPILAHWLMVALLMVGVRLQYR